MKFVFQSRVTPKVNDFILRFTEVSIRFTEKRFRYHIQSHLMSEVIFKSILDLGSRLKYYCHIHSEEQIVVTILLPHCSDRS